MINLTAVDTTDEVEELLDVTAIADIKKKSVSGAASYMLRTLFLHGIGIVSAGVLAAYLSAADFGIYGVVTQIIGLLTFFSDIGLGSALIQKKTAPTTKEYRTVFTVQQLLALGIFGITVAIVLSNVMEAKIGPAGEWVLLALGLSFPLTTLKTIPSVMIERRLEFSKLVIPQMVEQLLYQGVLILMAVNGMGVMAYAYAILLRTVVGVVVMWYLQRWPIGLSLDREALRAMIGTGTQFQLNDIIARIKDNLFYLALGLYFPNHIFGYITFAKNFSMLPYQLTVQNVIAITFPTYARLQHSPELLKKAIEKTLFFISLVIFPLLVGMCVFVFPFTHLVPRYAKWEPALIVFVLFTLSIGWSAVSTPLTNTLNAIGQIKTTLKLMVLWTVLTWVLTPILVLMMGFNGVGLAAFLIGITSILPIVIVKKVVPIQVWTQLWRQLIAAVVMAGVGVVGIPVWQRSFGWLFVGMAITGLAYVVVLVAVGKNKLLAEIQTLRHKA